MNHEDALDAIFDVEEADAAAGAAPAAASLSSDPTAATAGAPGATGTSGAPASTDEDANELLEFISSVATPAKAAPQGASSSHAGGMSASAASSLDVAAELENMFEALERGDAAPAAASVITPILSPRAVAAPAAPAPAAVEEQEEGEVPPVPAPVSSRASVAAAVVHALASAPEPPASVVAAMTADAVSAALVVAPPLTLEEALRAMEGVQSATSGETDATRVAELIRDEFKGCIPVRMRYRAYCALLLGRVPDASEGGSSDAPAPDAASEPIRADLEGVYKALQECVAAAVSTGHELLPPSVTLDEAAAILAQTCVEHNLKYSSTFVRLLCPLLVIGAPSPAAVRVLFHALLTRLCPSFLLQAWIAPPPAAPAAAEAPPVDAMYDDFAAGSRRASLTGAPDGLSAERVNAALAAVRLQSTAFHALTRMCLQYTQPAIVAKLDALVPAWWRPVGSADGAASSGCTPSHWFEHGFLSAGLHPHGALPLLDRLLTLSPPPTRVEAQPQLVAAAIDACARGSALVSWPPSDVGMSLVLMATALIAREAPSLQVIVTTHGTPDAPATAPAVAHKRASSAGATNAASYLIKLTLDGAPKRCVWQQSAQREGDGKADPFLDSTQAWLAAAVATARELPLSVRTCLARPGDREALGACLAGPRALMKSSSHLVEGVPPQEGEDAIDFSIGAPSCVRVSAEEVAMQLVYGWRRVSSVTPSLPGDDARGRQPSVLLPGEGGTSFDAPEASQDAPMLSSAFTYSKPVRFLIVDCRPIVHRRAGRLATAFHVDPRTCLPPELTAAQEEAAAEAAAAPHADESSHTHVIGDEAGEVEVAPVDDAAEDVRELAGDASAPTSAPTDVLISAAPTQPAAPVKAWAVVSANSAVGLPLKEAVEELMGLSGTVHFVVVGVGVRLIPAAYEPHLLDVCAAQDDVRTATVAEALMAAGCKYVSVLDGGFASVHSLLRSGNVPLPPTTGGDASAGDVDEASRVVLMDHISRKCAACRHATVARMLETSATHSSIFAGLAVNGDAMLTEMSNAAQTARRAVVDFFGGIQRRVAERRRAPLPATAADAAVSAAGSTADVSPGDGVVSTSRFAAFIDARNQAVSSILAKLRRQNGSGEPSKVSDAAAPPETGASDVVPPLDAARRPSETQAAAQLRSGAKSIAAAVFSAGKAALAPPVASAPRERTSSQAEVSTGAASFARGLQSRLVALTAAPPATQAVAAPPRRDSTADKSPRTDVAVAAPAPAPAPSSGDAAPRPRVASGTAGAGGAPPPRPVFTVADALNGPSRPRKSGATSSSAPTVAAVRSSMVASFSALTGAVRKAAGAAMRSDASVPAPAAAAPAPRAAAPAPAPMDSATALRALQLAGVSKGDALDMQTWSSGELFRCDKERQARDATVLASPAKDAPDAPPPEMRPRYLCLIRDRIIVVQAHPTRLGYGLVKSNHHLSELAKLSFSKKSPRRVVLWFRAGVAATPDGGGDAPLKPRVYHVDNYETFKTELQAAIARLGL